MVDFSLGPRSFSTFGSRRGCGVCGIQLGRAGDGDGDGDWLALHRYWLGAGWRLQQKAAAAAAAAEAGKQGCSDAARDRCLCVGLGLGLVDSWGLVAGAAAAAAAAAAARLLVPGSSLARTRARPAASMVQAGRLAGRWLAAGWTGGGCALRSGTKHLGRFRLERTATRSLGNVARPPARPALPCPALPACLCL